MCQERKVGEAGGMRRGRVRGDIGGARGARTAGGARTAEARTAMSRNALSLRDIAKRPSMHVRRSPFSARDAAYA